MITLDEIKQFFTKSDVEEEKRDVRLLKNLLSAVE